MSTTEETTPATSVFAGQGDAWVSYEAQLSFTGNLYGGSPFDPKLVEGWLSKNLGITDEEQLRQWMVKHLTEVQGLDPATVTDEMVMQAVEDSAVDKKAQGFKRTPNENQPYVEGRHIKAMIKEATNISFPQGENKWGKYKNTTGKEVGGKSPLSYVSERVWVPEQPYVVAQDADGFEFAVGHIEDWKGRRSTIGYFEYCTKPQFSIVIKVLDDCLTFDQWARIWQVAEGNGLGARRSQGGGQFSVTKWEKLDK